MYTDLTGKTENAIKVALMLTLGEGTTTQYTDKRPALFLRGGGFDSESTTITHTEDDHGHDKTVVDYCFNYAYQVAFGDYYIILRTPRQVLRLFDAIITAVQDYNKLHNVTAVFTLWAANLAHEWAFIKPHLFEHYTITKCFAKSTRDVLLIQLDSALELRECIGLFGRSLADIAKNWCSADNQKLTGQFDYNKVRTSDTPLDAETELPYMVHDVTTLSEMHDNIIKYYRQENGGVELPYTSSGFVRMKIKEHIRNDDDLTGERENYNTGKEKPIETNIEFLKYKNRNAVISPYQWCICREYSYSGGLCGSNIEYVGKILNNVVCADITSDYPAQMVQKKFPSGSLRRVSPDRYNEIKNSKRPYFAIWHIKSMKSKTQHATYSKHKILNLDINTPFAGTFGQPKNMVIYNGKVLRGENIIACWNDVDLAAYKEIYDMQGGVLELWVFDRYEKAPAWLTAAMCDDYINKANLKAAGKSGTIEYMESKRNVNSYYGVLAQKTTELNDEISVNDLNFKPSKIKTFREIQRDFYLNPYIAFWVTSYARAILMHFIAAHPHAIVQYDTDSLYYIKSKGADLEKELLQYNERITAINKRIFRERNDTIFDSLGTWDFDEIYTKFLGMGAKKYIKQDSTGIHTVIAGLPKKAIPAEIEKRGITQPFNYYNPLVQYVKNTRNAIVIDHIFAGKFASVYCDRLDREYVEITDHTGAKHMQEVGSYHAITPIDFTLSMKIEYLQHALHFDR